MLFILNKNILGREFLDYRLVNCFKDNFSVLENIVIFFINRVMKKFSIRGKY